LSVEESLGELSLYDKIVFESLQQIK